MRWGRCSLCWLPHRLTDTTRFNYTGNCSVITSPEVPKKRVIKFCALKSVEEIFQFWEINWKKCNCRTWRCCFRRQRRVEFPKYVFAASSNIVEFKERKMGRIFFFWKTSGFYMESGFLFDIFKAVVPGALPGIKGFLAGSKVWFPKRPISFLDRHTAGVTESDGER